MEVTRIDIENIGMFSQRDRDYYLAHEKFREFINYEFDFTQFENTIRERNKIPVNRQLLHDTLVQQYSDLSSGTLSMGNISKILDQDCFTVTTAHQPSLMTGPLYYIYKILSTINLSNKLKDKYPGHFVPVFVIGGEDHDFEEINHFYLFNKKIEWRSENTGSVGQFSVDNLDGVIEELKNVLGSNIHTDTIVQDLTSILKKSVNYGDFCFRLTHKFFDHMGLVILRMDHPELKAQFRSVIKDDLINSTSKQLVENAQNALQNKGYKPQAYVREINSFYRKDGIRNRIVRNKDGYDILETDISFTQQELSEELEHHPENFSPNVILRPLYQETILPNLAYIGGGGEIAYWAERKNQFAHYGVHFPMLIRRNSALIITETLNQQISKFGYTIDELFYPAEKLVGQHINQSADVDFKMENQKNQIDQIFADIEKRVELIDKSLLSTTKSELSKVHKSLDYLGSKLKKSIKQKEEVQIKRIHKLKDILFPSGLQERHDNIFEYVAQYGIGLMDKMLPFCDPFVKKFTVFVMQQQDRQIEPTDQKASL